MTQSETEDIFLRENYLRNKEILKFSVKVITSEGNAPDRYQLLLVTKHFSMFPADGGGRPAPLVQVDA